LQISDLVASAAADQILESAKNLRSALGTNDSIRFNVRLLALRPGSLKMMELTSIPQSIRQETLTRQTEVPTP
jgi:hypothetical protein